LVYRTKLAVLVYITRLKLFSTYTGNILLHILLHEKTRLILRTGGF
jgi:hypothetical protein